MAKDDGSPYGVFTPFSRRWLVAGQPLWADRPTTPDVAVVTWIAAGDIVSDAGPEAPVVDADLPAATSTAVHEQWARFVEGGLDHYASRRNLPGVERRSMRWQSPGSWSPVRAA